MDKRQTLSASGESLLAKRLHAVGRTLGTPVSGTFELTAGCNFNCRMCYVHDPGVRPGGRGELTADQWLAIGRQAADAGTVFLLLTGGEPLLRPDFAEIYTGLKRLGLVLSINTNGSLLTGETAALLERDPPMRLNVSLYAADAAGYESLCGADAFSRVRENILRMRDAGVPVKLNVSFTRQNAHDCEAIASLARDWGLHCKAASYMFPAARRAGSNADARLTPAQCASLRLRWERATGREDAIRTSAAMLARMRDRSCDEETAGEGVRCRAGSTAFWIDHTGRMLMCGQIPAGGGSVPADGFGPCWQRVREMAARVATPAKCAGCALRGVCSVCPAACYAETGAFDEAPAYLCEMSRCLARELADYDAGGEDV